MPRVPFRQVGESFLVCVLVAGCRTAAPTRPQSWFVVNPSSSLSARSSRDVLGSAEIGAAEVANAHEAVVRLRPEFLVRRAAVADDQYDGRPVVYLNDVRQGGTDMLRTIPALLVLDIRYLSGTAASAEFGPYYPGGVIAVRTRR